MRGNAATRCLPYAKERKSNVKKRLRLRKSNHMNATDKITVSTSRRGEPMKLLKRIGSTTYEVTVHFSNTSAETLEDKVRRLIEQEAEKSA
jgi:hypothetical protein